MSQVRAYVSQREEITFAGTVGPDAHPFSTIVSAPMVSEWATPPGTGFVLSHCPFQGVGASHEMLGITWAAHTARLAVSFEGSAHEPVGSSQLHASHALGATRSACPSYPVVIGPSGHSGACSSGPNQSNVGESHRDG
jgi:hypothetical protein